MQEKHVCRKQQLRPFQPWWPEEPDQWPHWSPDGKKQHIIFCPCSTFSIFHLVIDAVLCTLPDRHSGPHFPQHSQNSRLAKFKSQSSFAYWVVDVNPFVTFGFNKFPINEELYSWLENKNTTKLCISQLLLSLSQKGRNSGLIKWIFCSLEMLPLGKRYTMYLSLVFIKMWLSLSILWSLWERKIPC